MKQSQFGDVTAYADSGGGPMQFPSRYGVNWPSMGVMSTSYTRQFIQDLHNACEWVDAEKREDEKHEATEG